MYVSNNTVKPSVFSESQNMNNDKFKRRCENDCLSWLTKKEV